MHVNIERHAVGTCENAEAKSKSAQCTACQGSTSSSRDVISGELGTLLDRMASMEETICGLRELICNQRQKKELYTTGEVATILGRRNFTVREWCRLKRIVATKAISGRGSEKEWRVSHEELMRIQHEGLLPAPERY